MEKIENYQLGEFLGQGGFARVYQVLCQCCTLHFLWYTELSRRDVWPRAGRSPSRWWTRRRWSETG